MTPAVWMWACGIIVVACLIALRWVVPWWWRAWQELGPKGDGRHKADPLTRTPAPWPPAPPPVCASPGCWRWAGHDGECSTWYGSEPEIPAAAEAASPPAPPPPVTLLDKARAALAEREAEMAAIAAMEPGDYAEHLEDATAYADLPPLATVMDWSDETLMRFSVPELKAAMEQYGLEQAGETA